MDCSVSLVNCTVAKREHEPTNAGVSNSCATYAADQYKQTWPPFGDEDWQVWFIVSTAGGRGEQQWADTSFPVAIGPLGWVRGRSRRSFAPQGNWQGSPHNLTRLFWGLEQHESTRIAICSILYPERATKMNGEQARIIGTMPVTLQLCVLNADSGKDHSIQAILDTLLFNEDFPRHKIFGARSSHQANCTPLSG